MTAGFGWGDMVHDRCGHPLREHPDGLLDRCPFPPLVSVEFTTGPPEPGVPVVVVTGLPEELTPHLVRALADLGIAAAEALNVPYVVVQQGEEAP